MVKNSIDFQEILQQKVLEKYAKPLHSLKSFEDLSDAVKVSSQTLRRFFGKIDKDKTIGTSSLSIICKFVGYKDWSTFVEFCQSKDAISSKDKILIESMKTYFDNGKKYNENYLQNTLSTDTLNEYAKIIYDSSENMLFFYELYEDNDWIINYIFAWLPNYNYFGQTWYQNILIKQVSKKNGIDVKLAQLNFLHFGVFLTKQNVEIDSDLEILKKTYRQYLLEFSYLPYHEMRYATNLLISAKEQQDESSFQKILSDYLAKLKNAKLSERHHREIITVFANTLIWLNEFEIAYDLLLPIKKYTSDYKTFCSAETPLHFFGINMAVVKITFAIVWVLNKKDGNYFKVSTEEFNDNAGILYHDYIQTMHFALCILQENTLLKKQIIFEDLKIAVQKTGYIKIYDLLEANDSLFPKYYS
jgi:hypothetical protein